ncbi:fluoride efflux transporter FluC [Microbacterium esteraromaticum]|uniref:fluoride efflux transporter FluC n=1 Tax=Microbacterium esteraromaticum TaxID=57043 RepID=UPI001DE5EE83|nr:CrcB protein [Microbacterium esteraromaticum]
MTSPPTARTVLRRAALAAAGGAVGTAARLGLGMLIADAPASVLVANIVGAMLLGILTARLPASDLRILLGTGVLGGFTTYSAFAVDSIGLWSASPALAAGYVAASLIGGLLAAWIGLRVGGSLGRRSAS